MNDDRGIPGWPFDEQRPALAAVPTPLGPLHVGDRVRLHPGRARHNASDIMDIALNGKTAQIASIEQDYEGRIHVAVTIEDDPGRDLGRAALPAHRFFFSPDEVESLNNGRGELP